MYYRLPVPTKDVGVSFTFNDQSYRLAPIRRINRGEYIQYVTDIFWDERVIYGLVLHEGVNIVRQYGFCPLPSLYAQKKAGDITDLENFEEIYELFTEDS